MIKLKKNDGSTIEVETTRDGFFIIRYEGSENPCLIDRETMLDRCSQNYHDLTIISSFNLLGYILANEPKWDINHLGEIILSYNDEIIPEGIVEE